MITAATSPDQALVRELREIAVLKSLTDLASWDQETKMPERGAELRADQLELLAGLLHARRTSPELGDLIGACERDAPSDDAAAANIREARRDYDKAVKLPADLVRELARCRALAITAWKAARAANDFQAFLPWLEKTIDLSRRKAEHLGVPDGGELYDALIDEWEPDMTAARAAEIFTPLRAFTVNLLDRVKQGPPPDASIATIELPIEKQRAFSRRITEAMGFDYAGGRLDEAVHPFCETVGPGDVRITTRYRPDAWLDSLSCSAHEAGHGMYEQGLPAAHFGEPLGTAVSLGIHESQSRMWENFIGRSRPFWDWAIGVAREVFGRHFEGVDPETIFKADNVVTPSFIRVEADEVTYNLHIMLRFEMERALLRGDLAPKDVPGAWNDRMKADLGLDVPEDRVGCLQDIHWSMGSLGYFPTYTFGNLYAAQLWAAMGEAVPDREAQVRRGDFAGILRWLREHVHAHGRRWPAEELCRRITGKGLDADALMRHLEAKVEAVYGA